MFNNKPTDDPGLNSVIADCEAELRSMPSDSKEYKEALARYKDLHALKLSTQPKSVSPDTVVSASASILGILIIVGHEYAHPITSKALSFVKKLT